ITATLAFFGTLSTAGFPLPFVNGFYSKELFFESRLALQQQTTNVANLLVTIVRYRAVLGSIFTFDYSMYLFFGLFGKQKNKEINISQTIKEAPIGMLISPAILVLGIIAIGLIPNCFNQSFLQHAATSIHSSAIMENISYWHGLSTPFIMSLIVV